MWGLAKSFLGHVLPGVIKPLRVLWNEIIAFVFAAFAVVIGFSVGRDIANYDGTSEKATKIALSGIFALVMFLFAVQSYFRSRKIARS